MSEIRTYSLANKTGIYHHMQCPYVKRIRKTNRGRKTKYTLEKAGYRPCKCCNSARYHVKREAYTLHNYTEFKGITYRCIGNSVYVKTPVGYWRLKYLPREEEFLVLHGNRADREYDLDQMVHAHYHKQKDNPYASNLMDAFIYIYKHDKFRQEEEAAGGDVSKFQIDKKYEKAYLRSAKKKKRRRVEYLFRQIEREDAGMLQYSIC